MAISKVPRKKVYSSKKKIASSTSKVITKAVKSAVGKLAEVKQAEIFQNVPIGAFGYTNFNANNVMPLMPYAGWLAINQGTGQADRIGNKINLVSVKLKIILTPNIYSTTTNPEPTPVMIKMFLVNAKSFGAYNTMPTMTNLSTFFQAGNTSSPPTGGLTDIIDDVNLDLWNVYATKTLKLGFSAYPGTNNDLAQQLYSNNDYKMNHLIKWDITKHLPKTVVWNDTAGNVTSRGLFLVILMANSDGSSMVTSSVAPAVFRCELAVGYTDI